MSRADALAAIQRLDDAAFVLVTVGAAMVFPPAALIVGAMYLIGRALLLDRRLPDA